MPTQQSIEEPSPVGMLEGAASADSGERPFKPTDSIHWGALPFVMFHLAAIPLVWWVGFSWTGVAWCVALYYARMLFVCNGYHRYFAHRSYQVGRKRQFLLAFIAQTSCQKGALWWAAHHRVHHRFSDQPEDPHSPIQRGFWYSHVGWVLNNKNDETHFDRIKDFARFPELVWLNRWHFIPPIVLAAALYLIGGKVALIYGFVLSTVVLWHGTFTINSLTHVYGRKRFITTDESRNSLLLALITCGEGWHNNHHRHQHSAAQGFYWWQVDFAYYLLRIGKLFGVVKHIVEPTPEILAEGRLNLGSKPRVAAPKETSAVTSALAMPTAAEPTA